MPDRRAIRRIPLTGKDLLSPTEPMPREEEVKGHIREFLKKSWEARSAHPLLPVVSLTRTLPACQK
ncbi:hypothetical protein HHA02_17410 [Cobetia marina]|nr:hypothetical protein HHA02_17410 [Cobetia marina]